MNRAILASKLMGYLAPFKPKVIPTPPGKASAKPDAIAPPKDAEKAAINDAAKVSTIRTDIRFASEYVTSWPVIDSAISWLRGQKILTPNQIDKLRADVADQTAEGVALWADSLDRQLSDAIVKSQLSGETTLPWQDRVQQIITVTDSQAEAIARTYTHRAYHAGLEEVLDDPYVADEFPYVVYEATGDGRTRASHAAMGGKVAKRGSALYDEMQSLINDFNCRCTIIPLSEDEAKARGIDG
jgi:SPP1 gp7 family putative phage head morphogenesis protein